MKHHTVKTTTVASLLVLSFLASPTPSLGEIPQANMAAGSNAPACKVSFTPVAETNDVVACYDGKAGNKQVHNCTTISKSANLQGIALALQDGRDCSRVEVTGI